MLAAGSRFKLGKAQKLSGWGISYNERLLKLEGNTLAYYREVPKNFDRIFYCAK